MISHSYVHPCTYECTHVSAHTYTSLASVDPLWGQEHQCPCGFSAPWYHAGQIFLSAWMTPWHGVYLDWQLVFIWIDMRRGEKEEADGGGERPSGAHATIRPDMKNMGWQRTPGRGREGKVHLLTWWMSSFNVRSCTCHRLRTEIYVMKIKVSLHSSTSSFFSCWCKDVVFCGSLTHQHCQGKANKMSSEWNES